jgi:2-polyprenyl-3-methyl-5-hydroxy-6-metoxy-1,4-benzoquinol methylase
MTASSKTSRYDSFVCNVCANRSFSYYGKYNGFTGLKCDRCGLIFVENMPTAEELRDIYSAPSYYDDYWGGIGYHRAYETVLKKDFEAKVARIMRLLPDRGIRILEVGAGPGYFSKLLRDAGFGDVSCWDIADEAIRLGRSLGVDVRKVDIFEAEEGLESFDLVVSWATIEHIPDPRRFFARMMKFVRKGGYLMVDTGVADTLPDRMARGISPWFHPPQHLYVFTRRSLALLARGASRLKLVINDRRPWLARPARVLRVLLRSALVQGPNYVYDRCLVVAKK